MSLFYTPGLSLLGSCPKPHFKLVEERSKSTIEISILKCYECAVFIKTNVRFIFVCFLEGKDGRKDLPLPFV